MTEEHPFIAAAKKYSDEPDLDSAATTERAVTDFICMHPATRMDVLGQLDLVMQADDGTSLRQKAKLLSLSRALSDTHFTLRKVGR
jgi:hypothetical protein